MAYLRTLVFAFLAVAVAAAPATPCTMAKHASRDHAAFGTPVISGVGEAGHDHHHAVRDGTEAAIVPSAHVDGAGGDLDNALIVEATGQASGTFSHQQHRNTQNHQKRAAACPASCCPLACQAALPEAPWSGIVLDVRPSDPFGMAREDGVAGQRPLRIERPPRAIG